ncbi:MAG: hypothetical protein C5B53_06815 [Candidatus Melainabacteria bacterium]|nr:MAG: hypothetical protein C5B53_06815 [Candidatus Melainabacteria bacterium]
MFDLFEYRRKAVNLLNPKDLFLLWEDVCRCYDRGEIGKQELDEMRALIWPTLASLTALRKLIDNIEIVGTRSNISDQAAWR